MLDEKIRCCSLGTAFATLELEKKIAGNIKEQQTFECAETNFEKGQTTISKPLKTVCGKIEMFEHKMRLRFHFSCSRLSTNPVFCFRILVF